MPFDGIASIFLGNLGKTESEVQGKGYNKERGRPLQRRHNEFLSRRGFSRDAAKRAEKDLSGDEKHRDGPRNDQN